MFKPLFTQPIRAKAGDALEDALGHSLRKNTSLVLLWKRRLQLCLTI